MEKFKAFLLKFKDGFLKGAKLAKNYVNEVAVVAGAGSVAGLTFDSRWAILAGVVLGVGYAAFGKKLQKKVEEALEKK